MPKKQKAESLPHAIKVINLVPNDIEPLYVASKDVPKLILGLSAKTLANWRSLKVGPAFHLVKGAPYYAWQDLKEFFSQGRVETSNQEGL